MKIVIDLPVFVVAILSAEYFLISSEAFLPVRQVRTAGVTCQSTQLSVSIDQVVASDVENEGSYGRANQRRELSQQIISSLPYRELRKELESRGQSTEGTTSQLRRRLRQIALPDQDEECIVNEDGMEDDCQRAEMDKIMTFTDTSDPLQELVEEIKSKSMQGHWKSATRKLKKLTRRAGDRIIEEETYLSVLDACMANRLQGARASEPARKIIEQLVEQGYGITEEIGNYCIQNCLGDTGVTSTHQGFGGLDTALAIKAAIESVGTPLQPDTNDKLVLALAKEGSSAEAIKILSKMVVDQSQTPQLSTLAAAAQSAAFSKTDKDSEKVVEVLTYAKLAGYDLDKVAEFPEGRALIACGVIAAERMKNDALGFRLLTAAGKAEGVAPDRGDTMVVLSSAAAQRACTLIHKRALNKAIEDGEWKLAVKVLELMLQRGLKPSPWVWRNVVTCCAKAEKSRKATALLLDWVKLAARGEAEKPPLRVFNTVINTCEICNEQELTLLVLDEMHKTHETDGNLITFNIALKRLAKLGNFRACEGIIVGMLDSGVEPSIVTYTTAIAACVYKGNRQPTIAYEWLRRMRLRNVFPNVVAYNTALAACLDGKLASTILASKIATEMLADVDKQLQEFDEDLDEYHTVIPDLQTKEVARKIMQQLKQNWEDGEIDKRVATETVRVPLLKLVDFQKSEAAALAREQAASRKKDEDQSTTTEKIEIELEALAFHRSAEV